MRLEHGARIFECLFVTDVSNNGYGLEMSERRSQHEEVLVMTAFRPFGTRKVQVSMHVEKLDFEVVKRFLDTVKASLVDLVESPD
jgi:hypothetical protein